MKLGKIYGFLPNIHLEVNKLDVWYANIHKFDIDDKEIQFNFVYNNLKYNCSLLFVNEISLNGKIIVDGEKWGNLYMKLFKNESGYMLWGDWDELDVSDYITNYSCLIEIIL